MVERTAGAMRFESRWGKEKKFVCVGLYLPSLSYKCYVEFMCVLLIMISSVQFRGTYCMAATQSSLKKLFHLDALGGGIPTKKPVLNAFYTKIINFFIFTKYLGRGLGPDPMGTTPLPLSLP